MSKLAFIGAGNMCRAIVHGLINTGYQADAIVVTNPSAEKRLAMAATFGVQQTDDNLDAVRASEVIFLCVKPHLITQVCQEIASHIDISNKCFISVAAGTTVAQMSAVLGEQSAIIRAMPNTPSQLGLGVSGLFANSQVTAQQKVLAEQLMRAVGMVLWLENEAKIDDIICVSGSGPAYFFLFMEAMEQFALSRGFSATESRKLVEQTALGAAQMVINNEIPISQLRANVTSKGGTTNAAITTFIDGGLSQLVTKSMNAALQRAKDMAQTDH